MNYDVELLLVGFFIAWTGLIVAVSDVSPRELLGLIIFSAGFFVVLYSLWFGEKSMNSEESGEMK